MINHAQRVLLSGLVRGLRVKIGNGTLRDKDIDDAIGDLKRLGYEYDYGTFPRLENTKALAYEANASPTNLAEALLWKLGKWKSYQTFASYYLVPDKESKPSDVVFFAFAKHLRNTENPIYDQHVLRAVWAIGALDERESQKCKNQLLDKNNKWKSSGAGKYSRDCYDLFLCELKRLIPDGVNQGDVDKLLMPLGQAIKDYSQDYADFEALCGRTRQGPVSRV